MIVDHQEFKTAMNIIEPARETRSPAPILSTIRAMQVTGGLRLEATDLDMSFAATLPNEAVVKGDLDEFLISDPRAVLSSINAAGGKDVTVRIAAGKNNGIDHKLIFKAGDLKLSQENRNNPFEFPVVRPVANDQFKTELSADIIRHIQRVFPAISTEETRYYLNGVHVKKLEGEEWTYRFAATDGHRLFVVDVPLPGSIGDLPDAIIPRRFIQAIAKKLGKSKDAITFKIGNSTATNQPPKTTAPDSRHASHCSISGKVGDLDVTFDGKLIDGIYPDYNRVIPKNVPRNATFNSGKLRQAVQAVSCANSDKSIRAVKLEFGDGAVTISKKVGFNGGSDATFRVPCDHNCNRMTAGFNGKYILEALNSFKGDEIVLSMEEPTKDMDNKGAYLPVSGPTLLRDPADTAFFVVLMPMRV